MRDFYEVDKLENQFSTLVSTFIFQCREFEEGKIEMFEMRNTDSK